MFSDRLAHPFFTNVPQKDDFVHSCKFQHLTQSGSGVTRLF